MKCAEDFSLNEGHGQVIFSGHANVTTAYHVIGVSVNE